MAGLARMLSQLDLPDVGATASDSEPLESGGAHQEVNPLQPLRPLLMSLTTRLKLRTAVFKRRSYPPLDVWLHGMEISARGACAQRGIYGVKDIQHADV